MIASPLKKAFVTSVTIKKTFVVNWSGKYAELDEFNYVESIYCKVGQSLLQNVTTITKWYNFSYKMGQAL